MKKFIQVAAGIVLAGCNSLLAQTGGLEGVIVEKYYVSSAADTLTADSSGYLAPGSVTYRIYADLKPVYRLQAVYGVENHEMKIQTSTRFYNCRFSDGRSANDLHPAQLTYGTAMLDSWLSMGAASLDYQGVMKTEDDTSGNLAQQNKSGALQHVDPLAGIPLKEKDGMRFLRYQPATQYYHLDEDLHLFEYIWRDSVGGLIRTTDGAWASYGGVVGPQPENHVLIAQFTTDGVLSFELNMQIATPDGKIEKYVARNPGTEENILPTLIYSSASGKEVPHIGLTCSGDLKKVVSGQLLKFTAEVDEQSADHVVLMMDNRPVMTMHQSPFVFQVKADGQHHSFYATVTGKSGLRAASKTILLPALLPVN